MYFLIRKSKHALKSAYHIWRKAKKYCPTREYSLAGAKLKAFQEAILNKDQTVV